MRKSLRRWLHTHKAEVAITLISAFIGFVGGLGVRFDLNLNFQFDDKIDPVEFLSLVCTIILALVVVFVLDRQKDAEKSAKVVLLKRVEELHALVSENAASARGGRLPYTQAAAMLKRVELTVNRLWRLLEGAEVTCDPEVRLSILRQLEVMDPLLTDTPTAAPFLGNLPALRVENGILLFNEQRSNEVETAFEDLRDKLTTLDFAIING